MKNIRNVINVSEILVSITESDKGLPHYIEASLLQYFSIAFDFTANNFDGSSVQSK